ncbi:MAG TPA: MarR family winged helix-turn-helix transcriptional regulator [Blastocatellia bacterium]|nr:MarR family winged helix-turn-helix transcriptional regulator [Blastocatellia bacterium]
MSRGEKPDGLEADIYEQLTAARNYLRTVDDFYARAAAAHNTTLEHYQVLLAVHCLGETVLPLRVLAEHLVRDRTATGQLCKRMQQAGLLDLTYESNSHRPQLLVSLSERGKEVLHAITEDGLRDRDRYLTSLPPDKRLYLAEAVRFSWLDGLEDQTATGQPRVTGH